MMEIKLRIITKLYIYIDIYVTKLSKFEFTIAIQLQPKTEKKKSKKVTHIDQHQERVLAHILSNTWCIFFGIPNDNIIAMERECF